MLQMQLLLQKEGRKNEELALALMVVAQQLTPATSTSYFIVALILMAAYCIGQYRFSKDFR